MSANDNIIAARVDRLKKILNVRFFIESGSGQRCEPLSLGTIAFIRKHSDQFNDRQLAAAGFMI